MYSITMQRLKKRELNGEIYYQPAAKFVATVTKTQVCFIVDG